MSCIFCSIPSDAYLAENAYFYAIGDKSPVTKGHTLIISKRHVQDFFGLLPQEMEAMHNIVNAVKAVIDERYQPEAYNLGMNCGKLAGQTVYHFHLHIIPRYPKGIKSKEIQGLREFIKEIL